MYRDGKKKESEMDIRVYIGIQGVYGMERGDIYRLGEGGEGVTGEEGTMTKSQKESSGKRRRCTRKRK